MAYSDRRGGRSGGFGGGGGGGYQRRDGGGGGYDQDYQQRSGGGGGGGGSWDRGPQVEMQVGQELVGRIIGKGGSKIRELQDTSGARIKVNSGEVVDGMVNICLSGSAESCKYAEDLIKEIVDMFKDDQYGGGRGGGGGGGRYGGRGGGGFDGGRRGPQTCYGCGKEGHIARDCTADGGGGY